MPDLEPITREEMLLDGQDLEPITRKEMFIKRIYDKTQVVPEPITREEMFLKKAGDETTDVTIEQLNVSENGTYSEEGVAYSPVIVNVPAPPIPDNAYLLNEVEGLPKDIATFSDGSNLPMPSLKVGIEPIQEGSGDPSPTNIRPISGWTEANVSVCGKNLIDVSKLAQQVVTSQGDLRPGVPVKLQAGTYTISAQSGSLPFYITRPANNYSFVSINALPFTFSLDNDEEVIVRMAQLDISSWDYVNMQLEEGSSATTYEPYNGQTYTIQFTDGSNPLTVYGGTLDVVSGELKVVPYYASYNGETLEGEWISDRDVYVVGTTPTIGAQVVNIGATPQTYQLTPTQVKSLLGSNNVWADCGEILEGQYFSKEV
jgi:hypothetical protein